MYPRYRKKSRKYRIKAPTPRMSYPRKTLTRSLASLGLLAVLFVASLFSGSSVIEGVLYNSYTLPEWKSALMSLARSIEGCVRVPADWCTAVISDAKELINAEDQKATPVKALRETPPAKEESTESRSPEWHLPTKGEITSGYGERIHPVDGVPSVHEGIDIGAPAGQPVVASSVGRVIKTGHDSAGGNYVVVSHPEDYTTIYAHLDSIFVTPGEQVSPMIKIGEVGSTGISTGPHLHFEIKKGEENLDPLDYISIEER